MQPVIFGLAGHTLGEWEQAFLRDVDPAGIILFARNIETPAQVAALTAELRSLLGRDLLLLIDQEGGRVRRLRPPHWRDYPAMGGYAGQPHGAEALAIHSALMAADLKRLGINTDCIPLLDVPVSGAHDIIGDRALGTRVEDVIGLGRVVTSALAQVGVLPVIKHIPGHGRAGVDSHLSLPVVDTPRAALEESDFVPFKAFADAPLGMTAHVTYSALDADNPATLSKPVIGDVIRGHMGFAGLLMTDDLSMKALSGDMQSRTRASLAAGCDLILHCNGERAEMQAIAEALPGGSADLAARVDALLTGLGENLPDSDSEADMEARYKVLTGHDLRGAA